MTKLSIGIVGLPNVGKSTLFNIITKNQADVANYPFCTIDPNVGVVSVPDERVDTLAALSKSAKKIPAVVEFYDIAGLVKGANRGEGLGNQFLSHIRETDAMVMVLRVFQSDEIIHVENSVDPVRDMDIINTELALKDLDTIEKVFKKLEGEARTGSKDAVKALEAVRVVKEALDRGENIRDDRCKEAREHPRVKELNLLSSKKQLYLFNGDVEDVSDELKKKIESRRASYVVFNLATTENVSALIAEAYRTLDLISFFTTGEDETRAWTIRRGMKAPQAAGVIHTDFEKKFIRAEVISWQKLLEAAAYSTGLTPSTSSGQASSPQASSGQSPWAIAKQRGWIRLEGKEYIMQDGDVIVVRHG